MSVAHNSHACGVWAGFSNILWAGGSTVVPKRCWAISRLLRHYHCNSRIIWTEPVKYWPKVCLLACLDHTMLLQIIALSHTLYSIIVLVDDPQWRRLQRIEWQLILSNFAQMSQSVVVRNWDRFELGNVLILQRLLTKKQKRDCCIPWMPTGEKRSQRRILGCPSVVKPLLSWVWLQHCSQFCASKLLWWFFPHLLGKPAVHFKLAKFIIIHEV